MIGKVGSTNLDYDKSKGGVVLIKKSEIKVHDIEHLFLTRHSIRNFDNTDVSIDKLKKAIDLALKCPSACNRQSTRVYVIDAKKRLELGGDNDYNANKYLILTGDINAFTLAEQSDWVVNASIFAAYLSLTLHFVGIGNCIIRKELIRKSKYNEKMMKYCRIPDSEQIVLEMAIGNYRDEFLVPV